MEKILVNKKDIIGVVEYINVLIEALDIEDESTINYINEGYENIVMPLMHLTSRKDGSKWSEIRCDYICEEEGKLYVDAWQTCDDNEGGIVIAKIDMETKEVQYLDEDAKTDVYAQEIIKSVIADLN